MTADPRIRIARDHADVQACVALQRTVWRLSDLDVTGPIQLLATVNEGALLLVAEEPEGQVVGFSYAFPALQGAEPHLHSEMLGVLPGARGRGLGSRLKWAQRDEAVRRGLKLVTWTFDPLEAGSARFSLRRLGATVTEILPDLYRTAGHHGLPTDRLRVRWELQSPSVKERSGGGQAPTPAAPLLDAPRINEVSWDGDRPVSSPPLLDLDQTTLLFEVPAAWSELCRADPTAARAWHGLTRDVFETYFARRYRAVDLLTVKERGRPRPCYVLYRFPSSPSGDLTFL